MMLKDGFNVSDCFLLRAFRRDLELKLVFFLEILWYICRNVQYFQTFGVYILL